MQNSGTKRTCVYVAVAFLLVWGALTLLAMAGGGLEPLWRHVQTSTLALGAAVILAAVALELLNRGEEKGLAAILLVTITVALVLNLWAIWTDAPTWSMAGKLMASATFAALGVGAVSVIALTNLQKESWQGRVRMVVVALVSAVMGFMIVQVWFEGSAWARQAKGLMLILAAIGVAVVWALDVMARMNKKEEASN